jgi:hypothetical protein
MPRSVELGTEAVAELLRDNCESTTEPRLASLNEMVDLVLGRD